MPNPTCVKPNPSQLMPLYSDLFTRLKLKQLIRSQGITLYWRILTPLIVLWGMIYQRLSADCTCDAVISYLHSGATDAIDPEDTHQLPLSKRLVSNSTSAYVQARNRLPLELVQAYGALANRGVYRAFATQMEDVDAHPTQRVYPPEIASMVGNLLSDPDARRLEFGSGSILNLPVQTAVKTGTSSDYRDSWAIGYGDRYVVGVWMGNLDQTPTLGVTGSTGPALALRGTFAILNRFRETAALWLSPRLKRHVICADTGVAYQTEMKCPQRSEYFVGGTAPNQIAQTFPARTPDNAIRLRQPTPGLHMAYDPRLPAEYQGFEFVLQGVAEHDIVNWRINGDDVLGQQGAGYWWPLSRGRHSVGATVWRNGELVAYVDESLFVVK